MVDNLRLISTSINCLSKIDIPKTNICDEYDKAIMHCEHDQNYERITAFSQERKGIIPVNNQFVNVTLLNYTKPPNCLR